MNITVRLAEENDREFLYVLHCRTMRAVVEKTWGWDEAWQRADFERRLQQYRVYVIELDRYAIGGLLVEYKPDSIYIHEIQVLPEYQGHGTGTVVIRQLIDQAKTRGSTVSLSVASVNSRAKQLYERLGFYVTQHEPPLFRMQHDAGTE